MSKENDKLTTFIDSDVFLSVLQNVSNNHNGAATIQVLTLLLQQSLAIEYLIKVLNEGRMLKEEEINDYVVNNSHILAEVIADKLTQAEKDARLDAAMASYAKRGGKVYDA